MYRLRIISTYPRVSCTVSARVLIDLCCRWYWRKSGFGRYPCIQVMYRTGSTGDSATARKGRFNHLLPGVLLSRAASYRAWRQKRMRNRIKFRMLVGIVQFGANFDRDREDSKGSEPILMRTSGERRRRSAGIPCWSAPMHTPIIAGTWSSLSKASSWGPKLGSPRKLSVNTNSYAT